MIFRSYEEAYKKGRGEDIETENKLAENIDDVIFFKKSIKDHRCSFFPTRIREWIHHYGKCLYDGNLVKDIEEGITCESEIRCCKQKIQR